MSTCLVASCLAHRRRVFFQGWGEDAGQWCHTNGWPCHKDPSNARAVIGASGEWSMEDFQQRGEPWRATLTR